MEIDKDQCTMKPENGVYVYGLYIEGCTWDRKKKTLTDSNPGEMYTLMPVIHFSPTEKYEIRPDNLRNYSCPVYKTSVRAGVLSTTGQSTNYVLTVDIPLLEENSEQWILRGVALLCQLND